MQISNAIQSRRYPFGGSIVSNETQVLLKSKIESGADIVDAGSGKVSEWLSSGVSGITGQQSNASLRPTIDVAENCIDYVNANAERLDLNAPIELNGDTGYSILIGYDELTNDRYLFGTDNASGINLFMRSTTINIGFSSSNSQIFNYSGWVTRPTGKAILEITHKGAGNGMRLRMNNGSESPAPAAGILLDDITFFNQIGDHSVVASKSANGELGIFYIQNHPFTDDERSTAYAEMSAIYVPD